MNRSAPSPVYEIVFPGKDAIIENRSLRGIYFLILGGLRAMSRNKRIFEHDLMKKVGEIYYEP